MAHSLPRPFIIREITMSVQPLDGQPARGWSDLLAIGFGTTVAMWAVGYVGHMPLTDVPPVVFASLMLGLRSRRRLGRGPKNAPRRPRRHRRGPHRRPAQSAHSRQSADRPELRASRAACRTVGAGLFRHLRSAVGPSGRAIGTAFRTPRITSRRPGMSSSQGSPASPRCS